MFTSSGLIRYSPQLLGGKGGKYWVVTDGDPEIGRYMRHLYCLMNNRCKTLDRPAWKEHITVIRNEQPTDDKMVFWEKYNGLVIDFSWDLIPETDEYYYWIPIQCSFALDMREELGLPREPEYSLHLSIGHKPK